MNYKRINGIVYYIAKDIFNELLLNATVTKTGLNSSIPIESITLPCFLFDNSIRQNKNNNLYNMIIFTKYQMMTNTKEPNKSIFLIPNLDLFTKNYPFLNKNNAIQAVTNPYFDSIIYQKYQEFIK